jgi:hypothetical protein
LQARRQTSVTSPLLDALIEEVTRGAKNIPLCRAATFCGAQANYEWSGACRHPSKHLLAHTHRLSPCNQNSFDRPAGAASSQDILSLHARAGRSPAWREGKSVTTHTRPNRVPPTSGPTAAVSAGTVDMRRTLWSVAALAVLTAVYAAWPLWRAAFPLEISVDEPWNAYNAQRLLSGLPLYPNPDDLIANNYPPLSFMAVAALASLGMDAADAGRLLSLLAVGASGILIATCVRIFSGGWLAAAVAGLCFVATTSRFFDHYVGKNDPHLPALALMLLALTWFLRRVARGRAAEPAIFLMVVAGFYKHSLVATPTAALLWLLAIDRRIGFRGLSVGVAAAGVGLLLCLAAFGEVFIAQLLFAREHSLWWALGSLGQLQWIAPALIICGIWWWHDRNSAAASFTRLYAGLAFLAYFAQRSGQGVGINAQFELVAATALATGLAFERLRAIPFVRRIGLDHGRTLVVAVLLARLLVSTRAEAYLTVASPTYRARFEKSTELVMREVEAIRAMEGAIVCSTGTVCRLAGKPFVYDAFAQAQRVLTGNLKPDVLNARIAAQRLTFVANDARTRASALHVRH